MPIPVLEGHDLRGGAGAVALGEEHVVVLAAVERWVEIDQVNRLVADVFAQNGEVIAVVKLVFLHCGVILAQIVNLRNLLVWCEDGNALTCLWC